jgi:DNA-binding MurR/RpiR family transcriptional regulator
MRQGQIAFGFSNSGRSRSTVNALAEAGKCGAMTVGIASFPHTPLEKASEYFFQTSFPFGGGLTAALTARLALSSIMDAVYVLAAQHGGMSDRFKYMDDLLEVQLRVPGGKKQ